MTKTKEELNALKHEYETVTNKLKELNDNELKMVAGGNNEEPFWLHRGDCLKDKYSYNPEKFEVNNTTGRWSSGKTGSFQYVGSDFLAKYPYVLNVTP